MKYLLICHKDNPLSSQTIFSTKEDASTTINALCVAMGLDHHLNEDDWETSCDTFLTTELTDKQYKYLVEQDWSDEAWQSVHFAQSS